MTGAHDSRALAGRTIIVTRTSAQAGGLVRALEELGARVVAIPVIRLVDPDDWGPADRAIEALGTYDWTVFTSANAVERFLARTDARGLARADVRATLAAAQVAAVGPATASRCEAEGIRVDYIPETAVAEGLIEGFERMGLAVGTRVLLPRALEAREVLPDTLRERGAVVDVVPVYRTVAALPDASAIELIASGEADTVTFTSPSTARNFYRMLEGTGAEEKARGLLIGSIGPVTSDALRGLGLEPAAEAAEHTTRGLVDALVNAVTNID